MKIKQLFIVLFTVSVSYTSYSQTARQISMASGTTTCSCWKIQVQRLSHTDPSTVSYHKGLQAVSDGSSWIILSEDTYMSTTDAERARKHYISLGYKGAFPRKSYCYINGNNAAIVANTSPVVARSIEPISKKDIVVAPTTKRIPDAPRKLSPQELELRSHKKGPKIDDSLYVPQIKIVPKAPASIDTSRKALGRMSSTFYSGRRGNTTTRAMLTSNTSNYIPKIKFSI